MAVVPKTNLVMTVSKTSSWNGGYDGVFTLENKNNYDVLQWSATFDFPANEEFTWMSEGDVTRNGTKCTFQPKDWNQNIPAKTTKTLGFGGKETLPANLKYNQILPLVGNDPSLAKRGSWGAKNIAPYVDACAFPTPDLPAMSKASGLKFFTLAFITADSNNQASWAGVIPLNTQHMLNQVRQIRTSHGDVCVSFGGANGIELADAIKNLDTLVAEYSKVIDLYSLDRIDFDIEGGAVANADGVDRRNKAIAILNKKYPKLQITYCLPVLPTGLTLAGEQLVQNARKNNVSIESFNGMSMDFGDSAAPNPEGRMGKYVIMSCEHLRTQVLSAGFGAPKIGTIPMIGVNDVQSEVFRITDAQQVYNFFKNTPWMTYVGFWSTNRDQPGPGQGANPFNSGIKQKPYDFSKTFLGAVVNDMDPSPNKNPTPPSVPGIPDAPVVTPPVVTPPVVTPPVVTPQNKKFFAPYVESWNFWSGWVDAKKITDIPTKNVTLAFVLSAHGTPKFDGTMDINTFVEQAKGVQKKGGIVRISFGGATGTELSVAITDIKSLVAAYESVITMYNTRYIDLDIEGGAASDKASIARRNTAMALLLKKYPDLKIDYTLATMQNGLSGEGIAILKDAKAHGVKLHAVNLMAMDYGTNETQMGKAAISAAKAAKKQCDDMALSYDGIGITPMIGLNDTTPETFTIANANEVVAFVKETSWIVFTSHWAAGRDTKNVTKVSQKPWEFTQIFNNTN